MTGFSFALPFCEDSGLVWVCGVAGEEGMHFNSAAKGSWVQRAPDPKDPWRC
jgi:hypothetical protein